jgi:hypothetical protein
MRRKTLGAFIIAVCCFSCSTANFAQSDTPELPKPNNPGSSAQVFQKTFSASQVAAMNLLESVITDLRSRGNSPTVVLQRARAADALWRVNEAKARDIIFKAIEDLATPALPNLSTVDRKLREEQIKGIQEHAAALSEILTILNRYDPGAAETFLKKYESKASDSTPATIRDSSGESELLAQLALGLTPTQADASLRLGILALRGHDVPEATGALLFTLSRSNKNLGHTFFVAIVQTLQRSGYRYDPILNALFNYLFFTDGRLLSVEFKQDADLLLNHILVAVEAHVRDLKQSQSTASKPVVDSANALYRFILARLLPSLAVNAPERYSQMQGLLNDLERFLTQQQKQDAASFANTSRQLAGNGSALSSTIDDDLKRAEAESDPNLRGASLRRIVIAIMRVDPNRAAAIASKIENEGIRLKTKDDLSLLLASRKLRDGNFLAARQIALQIFDANLKIQVLVAVAEAIRRKDGSCDFEVLSDGYSIAQKDENRPEKVNELLILSEAFAQCSTNRGFEVLADAVKSLNQLKESSAVLPSIDSGKSRIVSYIVVGDKELSTDSHISANALTFDNLKPLIKADFLQAQYLGQQIQNPALRARFHISIARIALQEADGP